MEKGKAIITINHLSKDILDIGGVKFYSESYFKEQIRRAEFNAIQKEKNAHFQ